MVEGNAAIFVPSPSQHVREEKGSNHQIGVTPATLHYFDPQQVG